MASEEFLGTGEANDFVDDPLRGPGDFSIDDWQVEASKISDIFDGCAENSNQVVETERLIARLEELSECRNWVGLNLLAERIRKNCGPKVDKETYIEHYLTWKDDTQATVLQMMSAEKPRTLSTRRHGQRLMSISLGKITEKDDEPNNNNEFHGPSDKTKYTSFREETNQQSMKMDLLISENEHLKQALETQEEQHQHMEQQLSQQKKRIAELEKNHSHQVMLNQSLENGKEDFVKNTAQLTNKIEILESKIKRDEKEKSKRDDENHALEQRINTLEAENADLVKKVNTLKDAQAQATAAIRERDLKLRNCEKEKEELQVEVEDCRDNNKMLSNRLEDLRNETAGESLQPTPSITGPLPCQDYLNFSAEENGSFLSLANTKPSITIENPSPDYKPSIENEFQQLGHNSFTPGPFLGRQSLSLDVNSPNNSQLFPNAQIVFLDDSQIAHSTPKKPDSENGSSLEDTGVQAVDASTQTIAENIKTAEETTQTLDNSSQRWLKWLKIAWRAVGWGFFRSSVGLLLGLTIIFALLFFSLLTYNLTSIYSLPRHYRFDNLARFLDSFIEVRYNGPVPY